MHNRDKYPEIWAAKEKAEAALAPLMKARKVHTDKIDAIQLQIADLQAEKNAENDLAMKDIDRIRELKSEISRFARAMQATVASEG